MRFEKAPELQTITFTVTTTVKELNALAGEFVEMDCGEFSRRFPMSYALLENFPAEYDDLPVEFSLDD